MKVLVTGADGFIGRMLVDRLRSESADSKLLLVDRQFTRKLDERRSTRLAGDLGDADVLANITAFKPDRVFHLASVPGGAAAENFGLGLKVNLQGTIALLEALRRAESHPTVIFASTVGVYGVPLPSVIDEATQAAPTMSYGAHKLVGEMLMRDYSLRGFIDARSLRLPGIVARPPAPSGLLSAFMSDMIRALWNGSDYVCPVSSNARAWWMSRPCVVDNLLHAATLSSDVSSHRRVWLLPVLHASVADVVQAIARRRGEHVSNKIVFKANESLEAQFGRLPPLHCPQALADGFRNDGSLDVLVERALHD